MLSRFVGSPYLLHCNMGKSEQNFSNNLDKDTRIIFRKQLLLQVEKDILYSTRS
ncbi:hypothetical protein RMHFA_05699 [Roseomonas mucosa]|nr:hypothetical protein RMHFA_05699 [Roseomonas mucosa]